MGIFLQEFQQSFLSGVPKEDEEQSVNKDLYVSSQKRVKKLSKLIWKNIENYMKEAESLYGNVYERSKQTPTFH